MDTIFSGDILDILSLTIGELYGQLSLVLQISIGGLQCAEYSARHKRITKIDKLECLPLEIVSPG